MAITPISFPSLSFPGLGMSDTTTVQSAPTAATGPLTDGFGEVLAAQADRLDGLHNTADSLAVQAATGDLKDVHEYMIASTEASLSTQTVVAIRNKAVEAFNEIMRMPV